jgi:hypothetical protein
MKTIVIEAIDVVKSLGEGAGRVLAPKGVGCRRTPDSPCRLCRN